MESNRKLLSLGRNIEDLTARHSRIIIGILGTFKINFVGAQIMVGALLMSGNLPSKGEK